MIWRVTCRGNGPGSASNYPDALSHRALASPLEDARSHPITRRRCPRACLQRKQRCAAYAILDVKLDQGGDMTEGLDRIQSPPPTKLKWEWDWPRVFGAILTAIYL